MKISRIQIVRNGIKGCCPNCGQRTLFEPGRLFKVNEACPNCGLKIEKGDGAFLGPFVINYGVTAFGVVIPIIVLYFTGKIGAVTMAVLTFLASLGMPLLLYRLAWGWWLMIYYFFLPWNMPGNREGLPEDDE